MKKNNAFIYLLAFVCFSFAVNVFAVDPGKTIPIADHYKGGKDSLLADIKKELKYPAAALRNRKQGTVQVSVILMPDGSVTNMRVVADIGGGCGEEAMRVVKTLKFIAPGYQATLYISNFK
jgi:protein TonB